MITSSETERANVIRAPRTVAAGVVEVTLRNRGEGAHDAQLVRVDGDQTVNDVGGKVMEPGDEIATPGWAHAAGGVAPVEPGKQASVTVKLRPGRYFIVDTYAGDPPEVLPGAARELTVVGRPSGDLPSTPATIVQRDYGYELDGLRAGRNSVTLRNEGDQLHQAVFYELTDEDATIDEVRRGFASVQRPKASPPPGIVAAETTALDGGGEQIVEIDLERARYAVLCLMSDHRGGANHTSKGMVAELDVR